MVKNLCVPLCLNKTEIMTNEERFEFIDDFLRRCEDWMHNEDGRDVTLSRKYLLELQKQGQKLPIADVGETLDPLCQQIGMNRCDVCGSAYCKCI